MISESGLGSPLLRADQFLTSPPPEYPSIFSCSALHYRYSNVKMKGLRDVSRSSSFVHTGTFEVLLPVLEVFEEVEDATGTGVHGTSSKPLPVK